MTALKPSVIPFIQIQQEEIFFTSENWGRKEIVYKELLNKEKYQKPFPVDLPIERTYSVELRIKWKNVVQKYTSNITNEHFNTSNMELKCAQGDLYTDLWRCKDGTFISSSLVCDRSKDCADGDDEATVLCQGKETFQMKVIKYLILSKYLIGFVIFFLTLLPWVGSYNKNELQKNKQFQDEAVDKKIEATNRKSKRSKKGRKKRGDGFIDSYKDETEVNDADITDILETVRSVCTGTKDGGKIESIDFQRFDQMYQGCHSKGPNHTHSITKILKQVAEQENYVSICDTLFDRIQHLEHNVLHEDKKAAVTCLSNQLSLEYDTANAYINARERLGVFSRAKKKFFGVPKYCLSYRQYLALAFALGAFVAVMQALLLITFSYADLYYDFLVYSALEYLEISFINTPAKKLRLISNLDIGMVKYHYIAVSLATFILIHLIYARSVDRLRFYPKTRLGKCVFALSYFFPYHFIGLMIAKLALERMKLEKKLNSVIEKVLGKKKHVDLPIAQDYRLRTFTLKNNYEYVQEIRSIGIRFALTELVLESIPQCITLVSIVISQLTTGYPKLQILYENFFKNMLGFNGATLCVIVIFAKMSSFTTKLVDASWERFHPMSIGIPGLILNGVAHSLILFSKIVLLSIGLSSSPYLYTPVSFIELGLLVLYLKITGSSTKFWKCIFPAWFSLTNLPDDVRSNHMWRKNKSCIGIPRTVLAHFAQLILIYVPFYMMTRYLEPLERFRSVHTQEVHLIGCLVYALVVVPFALLVWIFRSYCSRWLYLKQDMSKTSRLQMDARNADTLEDFENQTINRPDRRLEQQNAPSKRILVDPFRAHTSFMTENRPFLK